MDAAQTNVKKLVLYLATALLLTAPLQATTQTLITGATSVSIGSASCNESQSVALSSSDSKNLTFTVGIIYATDNPYGNWLYASIPDTGSTQTAATFQAQTGTTGTSLTIGLNSNAGFGTASPSATVQLTDTVTLQQVNITVFYTLNTSCGGNTGSVSNGFLSISPGNVALAAATNGQNSQNLTIQNTTSSSTTFGFSVSPSGSWLSAAATTTVLNAGGTATVTVTGNAAQTAGVGTYNGTVTVTPATGFGNTLTINVVFTVGSGGGGGGGGNGSNTLTINGATNNTYTTSFNFIAPSAPGGQCIPIQDSATGASSYTWSVNTSNGGNWLYANNSLSGSTNQLLASSYNACVNLSLSSVANSLASGAYQGSVGLTSSSGATATIYVNLYVSGGLAPGVSVGQGSLIFVFQNVAVSANVVQEQVFSLTSASGYVFGTASLSSNGNGFSTTSPIASNNTESFTVISNSTGLTAGVYAATVTLPSTHNGVTNNTVITVILPVGQGGTTCTSNCGNNTTTTTVAPTSLAFQQQTGNSFWTGGQEAQAITITGTQGSTWSAGITYAGSASGWLTFDSPSSGTGTFGNSPATLSVDLRNPGSLAASATPYQATVSITTTSGTYTVAVTLLVTTSNTPVLLGLPASTAFAATTGQTPASQTVTIVGSDNTGSASNPPTTPPITAGTPTASWVTATTSNNSLTIKVTPGSLSTGVYSATIPVSANAYSNPINYPVVMVLNGGGGGTTTGGPLNLSTTSLSYTNVTASITQNLTISVNSGSAQVTLSSSETSCNSFNWLSVTNGGYTAGTANTTIPVTVNPSGIANGTTCTGVITLVTSGTNGGTQTVNVSMAVGASSGSGNVTVSPTTMTFTYTQSQTVPAAQTATIVNTTSGTASINFTVATTEQSGASVNWLSTNVASGTTVSTPYNSPGLSVSVTPGNLGAGTYQGTVKITPNGGTEVDIAVTLTVISNAVVSATPTSLTLSYTVGGTSPTGTIQVSGGGSAAAFTTSVTSDHSWLQISPTSGTTATSGTNNLNVSVIASVLSTLNPNPTGSPYTGSITVTGTSPATGTTIINVSLNITAPLPVITGITNAASGAVGSVSPGEIISIFGTPANPIGPATSVQLNSTTCPSPCTVIPKSMGGVQVKFLPDGVFAPLIFVNQGQINAIVPYEVAGIASLEVEVLYLGQTSNAWPVSLAATAPGLFTGNSSGTGQAAAYQYDTQGVGSYNLPSSPAKAGWTLVLYMTGEGLVYPQPASGGVTVYNANANPPVPVPGVKPNVLIGGQPATLSFYGEAPTFVSGVMQLNVIVPAGAGTGAQLVSISMGTSSSQASVTVSLQ